MKKRAIRRHHSRRVAAKRRKLMLAKRQDHLAESSDNQLAVKHPLDCGGRCLMCHGEKFLDPRRAREKRATARLVAEAMKLPYHEVR
jgi:hypothetical protein